MEPGGDGSADATYLWMMLLAALGGSSPVLRVGGRVALPDPPPGGWVRVEFVGGETMNRRECKNKYGLAFSKTRRELLSSVKKAYLDGDCIDLVGVTGERPAWAERGVTIAGEVETYWVLLASNERMENYLIYLRGLVKNCGRALHDIERPGTYQLQLGEGALRAMRGLLNAWDVAGPGSPWQGESRLRISASSVKVTLLRRIS